MEKTTVGVITMYRDNYGAFLQAYALQKTLIKLGYSAELINYDNRKESTILGIPLCEIKNIKYFARRLLVEILLHRKHLQRQKRFDKSIKEYLRESKEQYFSYAQLRENPPEYDIYLTGSDQVFNPNLEPQSYKARLLEFANGKKVSYAASTGNVNGLKGKEQSLLEALKTYTQISVREEEAKIFLGEHLALEIERNIDPTLLLDKSEWVSFAKKPEYLSGKYIFYYRVLVQPELEKITSELSKKMNIPVFAADGNAKFDNQIQRQGYLGPEEWVGALMNAEYVVTNSFHGVAFSINLQKKVRVVLPPSNRSRIEDILQKSNVEKLTYPDILEDGEINELYKCSEYFFAEEREKAVTYLSKIGRDIEE